MASTSDFRSAMILKIEGELWSIVDFQHVKIGRGGAFVRTKLKNIQSGRVLEKTFRAGEKVDEARLERRSTQYLYREGEHLVVMDNETFEQIHLDAGLLDTSIKFLKEGENISLLMHNDSPVGAEIPFFVELKVVSTAPGFKGDTVSGTTKPAVLETGGKVQVPLFIEEGEIIRIDTRTGTYIERVR
ncbi:elongation factor P [candidate division KSB1 bacterium RBG_16_48_16]|nr:MAG: elongation factor P [candidate division KSB1 bacterium RBG_16_48_16]